MNSPADLQPLAFRAPGRGALAALGDAMRRHRRLIIGIQWTVVAFYLALVTLPAFLPLPPASASIVSNLTLFAQFVFWGLWWPFVMVSMMLLGRVWCGMFCPEGALTELASRHGLGRAIPRWMRWSGWPAFAFIMTTVYGQLVSVYEYPQPALLILGGSTAAAVLVGFVYGKGTRVWCRHLCPASGVFALLAKVAPLHFRTDEAAWKAHTGRAERIQCAPLVDLRHLSSASECHACGRCSGHRSAIALVRRSPNREILSLRPGQASRSAAILLLFGVLGVAIGAFQWSASPWFVAMKQAAAEWLVEHDAFLLLQDNAPWWLLTHYPAANDVFTWLDGLCILVYVGAAALLIGGGSLLALMAAERVAGGARFGRYDWASLAMALVPLAGVSVFLGLSTMTVAHLKAEGLVLAWLGGARGALLALGAAWSLWLGGRIVAGSGAALVKRAAALLLYAVPVALVAAAWLLMFYVW